MCLCACVRVYVYVYVCVQVKLVVIDSIACPFRQEGGAALRSRLLSSLSQDLYRSALQKSVAVVVVNHVTTKVLRGGGEAGESQVSE